MTLLRPGDLAWKFMAIAEAHSLKCIQRVTEPQAVCQAHQQQVNDSKASHLVSEPGCGPGKAGDVWTEGQPRGSKNLETVSLQVRAGRCLQPHATMFILVLQR